MKLFRCGNCGQLLHFENTECQRCGHALGYFWERNDLIALAEADGGSLAPAPDHGQRYRWCGNAEHGVCDSLLADDAEGDLCRACRLNRTIPDLSVPEHLPRWGRLEAAKRRLVYSLIRLGLPLIDKVEDPENGLAFDFLADPPEGRVMTGHAGGVITLNIAEADDAEREKIRQEMGEPYRTLLGHFRHETGHYYWDRLVRDGGRLDEFRELFGDERQGYAEALKRHYDAGPTADWQGRFVTGYASAHPWEDWAETWAHYLHTVSTLESAYAFGLRIRPEADTEKALTVRANFDPFEQDDFDAIVEAWVPVTVAVNSLNREMGQPDLYPFVAGPTVAEKLRLVHRIVRESGRPA